MGHVVSLVSFAQTLKPGKATHSLAYSHIALQPSHWPFFLFPAMLPFLDVKNPRVRQEWGRI